MNIFVITNDALRKQIRTAGQGNTDQTESCTAAVPGERKRLWLDPGYPTRHNLFPSSERIPPVPGPLPPDHRQSVPELSALLRDPAAIPT